MDGVSFPGMERPIVFLALALVFMLVPVSLLDSGPSLCVVQNLFGRECPGCGITRAMVSLFHGDPVAAFRYNRAIVLVFPILCYVFLQDLRSYFKTYRRDRRGRREDHFSRFPSASSAGSAVKAGLRQINGLRGH